MEALMEAHLAISQVFPGAFSYSNIKDLDMKELKYLLKRYKELKPKAV